MLTKQVEEPWLLFCFDGFFFFVLSLCHMLSILHVNLGVPIN